MEKVELIPEERLLAEVFGEYPEPGQHLCSPEKQGELKRAINEVLGTLTERQREVLESLFGLKNGHPKTLLEAGKEFGVTKERIRQITAKAIRKLRHPSRSKYLKNYFIRFPTSEERKDSRAVRQIIFQWVEKMRPDNTPRQRLAIKTKLYERLLRTGIARLSRLKKFTKEEVVVLLNLKSRGTVTEQCLRIVWQKANQ